MFNLLDAAKTVLNSVSSTNLFPWNFIDPNHGPFQLSSQMTRQKETRSLERKRKKEQIEPNLTKKMKPTPINEEAFPLPLQLVPETASQKSLQLSSYTCSHTPPASPLQSPLQSPIKSTKTPVQSPQEPEEPKEPDQPDQSKTIIEEVVLSSAASTPTSQTRGLNSPSRSPPLCTNSQSTTSVQPLENPHQSITVIEEVILSSPSSCAHSRSPSISPLQSPKKPNQAKTSVREDLVSSISNSTPHAIEINQLSPSALSILSLQNFNFFSNNLKLLNKLTDGDFNYNQFKGELKSSFDIIMFYLLVEAKTSLNAASLINLFPWNFDVFHIGIHPHEPYQVFSSIHGNLPLPENTVRNDFQRKVSIVVVKNRKRFICTNSLCNHGDEKFPKKENIVIHLYKKYVLFVCVACGALFHEKCTLGAHQASHCRFKKKSKTPDNFNNDIKNKDDKKFEDGNEKNVIDIKTEEEVFKILIQTALNRAHEDGLLIQFEKIDTLMTTLSTDSKAMSFLVLLSSIIMCQEGKYGLERDELQCHDDYYKIWMDTERCFQIVELATKKAISIEILESRLKRSVGKEGDSYICKYPICRCSGEFKRNSKSEIISHIEQSNYRLVCCGCHSSFKVISSLIRHSNENCKHSKLLDKMKEATKKY